jgi:hypothetical protein
MRISLSIRSEGGICVLRTQSGEIHKGDEQNPY